MDSMTHGTGTTTAAALLIWSLAVTGIPSLNVLAPELVTALIGLLLGMQSLH